MPIDPIGGSFSAYDQQLLGSDPYSPSQGSAAQQTQDLAPLDKQTFGAAVVSNTLDYLNSQGPSGLDVAPLDKLTFEAAVVSKTLDYLNSGQGRDNGMSQNYDFQKSVLGGHADAIGALANIKV